MKLNLRFNYNIKNFIQEHLTLVLEYERIRNKDLKRHFQSMYQYNNEKRHGEISYLTSAQKLLKLKIENSLVEKSQGRTKKFSTFTLLNLLHNYLTGQNQYRSPLENKFLTGQVVDEKSTINSDHFVTELVR